MYSNKKVSIEDLNFYPVGDQIRNVIISKIDLYDENKKYNLMLMILGTAAFLSIVDIALKHSEAAIWIIGCVLLCIIALRAFFVNNRSMHAKIKYMKESLMSSQFQIAYALIDKLDIQKNLYTDINSGKVTGYNYEVYATLKNFDGCHIKESVPCVIKLEHDSNKEEPEVDFKEGEKIYIIRYIHNDEYHYYGIKEGSAEYFEENLKFILECPDYNRINIEA